MPVKRILASVCFALAICGSVWAGPYEDADAASRRGDYATALKLFLALAMEGDAEAQISIANMYFDGRGVPLDYGEAVKWYLLAAEHGSADAQIALGFLYEYGDAVPQDLVEAYKWFDLAGSFSYRDAVGAKMTPEQITEAQRLGREWKPK